MPIDREFGRRLSDKLINNTFAGARRECVITQASGSYNPITEQYDGSLAHTGLCILTQLSRADDGNQNVQDADFIIKKRCAEVVDDTTGELMVIRNDNTTIKVQQLDPRDDTQTKMVNATIVDVKNDGVDAVYTIYGKYA